MQIKTSLIIGVMVGYIAYYLIKRIFNIVDYKIRNDNEVEIPPRRQDKYKRLYQEYEDIENTLEHNLFEINELDIKGENYENNTQR